MQRMQNIKGIAAPALAINARGDVKERLARVLREGGRR
jgi:hypothetical protein